MRRLVDTPEAWESLDLRADVIGRRTTKSGRLSIMGRLHLFLLARSVVQQVQLCTNTVLIGNKMCVQVYPQLFVLVLSTFRVKYFHKSGSSSFPFLE